MEKTRRSGKEVKTTWHAAPPFEEVWVLASDLRTARPRLLLARDSADDAISLLGYHPRENCRTTTTTTTAVYTNVSRPIQSGMHARETSGTPLL
jgi:hypothetical protein